jgi:hypothetical protein
MVIFLVIWSILLSILALYILVLLDLLCLEKKLGRSIRILNPRSITACAGGSGQNTLIATTPSPRPSPRYCGEDFFRQRADSRAGETMRRNSVCELRGGASRR